MPDAAPLRDDSYIPVGYCPSCGYPCDPGICSECGRNVQRPLRLPPSFRRNALFVARCLAYVIFTVGVLGVMCWWVVYRFVPTRTVEAATNSGNAWIREVAIDVRSWRALHIESESIAKESRIESEIAQFEQHPWAGSYVCGGEYLRSRLCISPREGMAITDLGSCGNGYMGPTCTGSLIAESTERLLFQETRYSWGNEAARSIEWVRTVWGDRELLLRGDQRFGPDGARIRLRMFADVFFFREHDRNRELVGLPRLPDSMRDKLDLGWKLAEITDADFIEVRTQPDSARVLRVYCEVPLCLVDESEPVGLFDELPFPKIVDIAPDYSLLMYEQIVPVGEIFEPPKRGWHFAYYPFERGTLRDLNKE